jgi:hypothetical protein
MRNIAASVPGDTHAVLFYKLDCQPEHCLEKIIENKF